MSAHGRIAVGLAIGVLIGALARWAGGGVLAAVVAIEPLGNLFVRLVTMVVVPLVIASLFVSIASLGNLSRLGRVGGRTLLYFVLTTLAAALVGAGVALALGVGTGGSAGAVPPASPTPSVGQTAVPGFMETIVALVPTNPVAAAAQGELLPLVVAVCLFAAAASVIRHEPRQLLVSFFSAVNDLAMVVLRWVMAIAPVAVLILMAAAVARTGLELLGSLAAFVLAVVVALALHVAIVLLPILRTFSKVPLGRFLRESSDALLLAFSTASSSVALPVTLAAAGRLGVADEVASFLLPVGATVNKNGSAVYKAVTAVFIAHLAGLPVGPSLFVTIVAMATVAAFTGAGVPGSSLVTTLMVLRAMGLEAQAAAGIALVAGVDRPLDMCRTFANTVGNLVGACVVGGRRGTASS